MTAMKKDGFVSVLFHCHYLVYIERYIDSIIEPNRTENRLIID